MTLQPTYQYFLTPIDLGSNKITSLATPTNLTDALCKSYVAGLVNLSVNYATTPVPKSLSYWLETINEFSYNLSFNPGNYNI